MAAQEADPIRVAWSKTYIFTNANANTATITDLAANTDSDANDANGYGDWFYQPGNEQCGELHQSRRWAGELAGPYEQWQLRCR
jgi:PKD repeat protein